MKLYNSSIDRLDAYVGGMLEADGNGPGELFTAIIKDQFERLRDSDRFWFENKQNGFELPGVFLFTKMPPIQIVHRTRDWIHP